MGIVVVAVAAACLRMYRLDQLPPALFRDEAEKIYNAWCLATTARDCSGNFLPLFVRVFGVTTSAIYQYAAVPFVWVLGVGEWAARLPAAIVGTLTVLLLMFWMRRAFGGRVALWAGAFLALSPWHVVFSRWAQQGIFLPFLLTAAMLGWEWFLSGRRAGILLTAVGYALAIYTYDVARAFVPLLLVTHVLLFRRELLAHWRWTAAAALCLALLSYPTLRLLLVQTEAAQARFSRISIFSPGQSWLDVTIMFFRNYGSHFAPSFLLLRGDAELRHGPGVGVLTFAEFAALLMGLGCLVRERSPRHLLLMAWIVFFPVAASLTREGIPHALRCIVALPAVQAVAGMGMAVGEKRLKSLCARPVWSFLAGALLLSFVPFAYQYFGRYATRSAVNWQYGVKQALTLVHNWDPALDRVAFHNIFGAEYLVAVYAKLPPGTFRLEQASCGKFECLPLGRNLSVWPPLRTEAVAVVTLPLGPPPPGVAVIPIHAPNSEDVVAVIYLNDNARKRLQQMTQQ